jgi:hypothetical protein
MAKRGGKRRDPAREKFWRRTIREQQRSGLSVRDFFQREGLKDGAFRWWRQELPRRDQQPSITPRSERTEAAPAFLPVRVVDFEAVSPHPVPSIEIVLPTGPTVRVPQGVAVHRCSDPLLMRDVRVPVYSPSSNRRLSSPRSPRSIHPARDGSPSPSWMSSPAYGLQDVPAPPDLAPEHPAGLPPQPPGKSDGASAPSNHAPTAASR